MAKNWFKTAKTAARKINIKSTAVVVDTETLIPPSNKNAHPLQYLDPNTKKPPEVIRWTWSPITGEMRIGPTTTHASQTGGQPFDSLVRGFYFPQKKLIAIRPFFWPQGAYDYWDESHEELNVKVTNAITTILKLALPKAQIEQQTDNQWLKNKIDPFRKW